MRIVAIVGSNRRGNTYAMVEGACHALNSECDVELIHLKDITVNLCDGCLSCDETGSCHIEDGVSEVVSSVSAADGLILGTPSRWSLLSGELKVLIDRLNPLAMPEALAGKKAIVFAVGQSTPEEDRSVELTCQSVRSFCDNAGIEIVQTVLAHGCLNAGDLIEKHPEALTECKAAAKALLNALNG